MAIPTIHICDRANLKTILNITGTADDNLIDLILGGIQTKFDTYCARVFLLPSSDATELITADGDVLSLPSYPVVTVTSVKEASDWDHAGATALTADTDYHVEKATGLIYRVGTDWMPEPEATQVVYSGGYVSATGTPGAGETIMPDDIQRAAFYQCRYEYSNRMSFGLQSVSGAGASASFASAGLLPEVKEILDSYARYVFV